MFVDTRHDSWTVYVISRSLTNPSLFASNLGLYYLPTDGFSVSMAILKNVLSTGLRIS